MTSLLKSKRATMAKQGIDLGLGAIFILAIGLTITVSVIDNLTLTGVTSTVADFAPLVVVAGFIFFVAKLMGMI